MTLEPDGAAHYREHGWVRLGRIASPQEVAALRREAERFRLDVGYGGEENATLRVNIQLCHRSRAVRSFCTGGSHIADLVALMGPNVCLPHQQFVTKLPDRGEERSDIPLHQDNGYGRLVLEDPNSWMVAGEA